MHVAGNEFSDRVNQSTLYAKRQKILEENKEQSIFCFIRFVCKVFEKL